MGSPDFAVMPLEYLVLNGFDVVAVYTQPDRPAGRSGQPAPPPVKRAALKLGIPVIQPAGLKDPAAEAELRRLRSDAIVVAAYGQILPRAVLETPLLGCLNIHPSLLPRYRGASPVAAAILEGDDFTGISIMLMETGLDTGPVLEQASVSISGTDTTGLLTAKLSLVGAWLIQDVLVRMSRDGLKPRAQDDALSSYAPPLTKEQGEIDWSRSAVQIWRSVRAFQPWPGAHTHWLGKRFNIIEAIPLPGETGAGEPGQVMALTPQMKARTAAGFAVSTGEGSLGIIRVQMEGRRILPAEELLRGRPDLVGARLG